MLCKCNTGGQLNAIQENDVRSNLKLMISTQNWAKKNNVGKILNIVEANYENCIKNLQTHMNCNAT